MSFRPALFLFFGFLRAAQPQKAPSFILGKGAQLTLIARDQSLPRVARKVFFRTKRNRLLLPRRPAADSSVEPTRRKTRLSKSHDAAMKPRHFIRPWRWALRLGVQAAEKMYLQTRFHAIGEPMVNGVTKCE